MTPNTAAAPGVIRQANGLIRGCETARVTVNATVENAIACSTNAATVALFEPGQTLRDHCGTLGSRFPTSDRRAAAAAGRTSSVSPLAFCIGASPTTGGTVVHR
jgi:hypothetical protein